MVGCKSAWRGRTSYGRFRESRSLGRAWFSAGLRWEGREPARAGGLARPHWPQKAPRDGLLLPAASALFPRIFAAGLF